MTTINNPVSCRRVLARQLVTSDGIESMKVISVDNLTGNLTVKPFEEETHSTVFVPAVAILNSNTLSEFLLDDIEQMLGNNASIDTVYHYLASSSLLAHPDSAADCAALISLSVPVDIIRISI